MSEALASLPVGCKVRFTGYRSAGWDMPPKIKIGEIGEVVSVKQDYQFGFDYWVRFESGTFAFNFGEVEAVK